MSFIVHPDVPLVQGLAKVLESHGLRLSRSFASGNPFLFTSADVKQTLHAQTSHLQVLVLGATMMKKEKLAKLVGQKRKVNQLNEVARELSGPTFLIASDDIGQVRVQGSGSGTSAVFWSNWQDTIIVSDDQLLLSNILKSEVNLNELAVRLSDAELFYPFNTGVIWSGVNPVQPGSWLQVQPNGTPKVIPWWTAPEPKDNLDTLSPLLAQAVRDSIRDHLNPETGLCSDLSGGLDSTTLAYFAKELHPDLHTVFLRSGDVANADHEWSDQVAKEIQSNHHVLPYASATGDLGVPVQDLVTIFPEGPSQAAPYAALVNTLENEFSAISPAIHLNGHGGDELFGHVSAMPWSFIRSKHRRKWKTVLEFGRVNKQSLASTLRLISRNGTPLDDLLRVANSNFVGYHNPYADGSKWIPGVQLPSCLTGSAKERLRYRLLQYRNRSDLTLHVDRTSHQIREGVLYHGTLVRRINQMSTPGSNLTFVSPYLDDKVVQIAMRLNIGERFCARFVKPLLTQARPNSVSVPYFQRLDKGEYSAETFIEYKTVQNRIWQTFANGSKLEDYGLLNPGEFRRMLVKYSPDGELHEQVMRIELVEQWLRSAYEPLKQLSPSSEDSD